MSSITINYEVDEALDELLQSALTSSWSVDDKRPHGGLLPIEVAILTPTINKGMTSYSMITSAMILCFIKVTSGDIFECLYLTFTACATNCNNDVKTSKAKQIAQTL